MSKVFKMAFEIAGELDSSFRNSFKDAGSDIKKLSTQLRELKAEQKRMDDIGLKRGFSSQWAEENRAQIEKVTKARERLLAVERMSDKAAAGREKWGKMFVKTAVVGGLVFGPMINEAMQFESQMADVRKVVDFDTPEQYKQMQKDIVALSQSIPMTAEGLAAIVAAGGQAGIARGDLIAFAESAAKMGVAFDISADQAGDMMAKWRTSFRMNQEQVVALADRINYLSDSTAATAPQISAIITRIGPLGEVAGISSDQLAALGATLASMGIQEEVAATGLKNMMLVMNSGASATKRQRAAFESLGIDASTMAKRMQVDGKAAIMDLLAAVNKLPKEQQASILTQLFGRESVGAIAPLLNNTEALAANFEKVANAENYAGSMAKEFASRSATTANAMQLAKNSIAAIAITLGSMFLPAVSEGFKAIGGFVNQLAVWAQDNPGTAQTIGMVAAGAIGLTLAVSALGFAYNVLLGGVANVIGSFVKLVTWYALGTAATNGMTGAQIIQAQWTKALTAAQWLWNAAMSANPIGLVILGIGALVAAGYALYQNWDIISEKATALWSTIWGLGKKVFDFYVDFWTKLPERVAYGVGYMIGFVATIPERLGYWGSLAWTSFTTWISKTVNDAVYLFMNLPQLASVAFNNFINATSDWGKNVLAEITAWALKIPSIISSAISDAGTNLKNWALNIGTNLDAGKKDGGKLPGHADGGIFNREHIARFAEGNRPEAVVPIDGSQRARNIWNRTGEMLGMNSGGQGGGSSFSYTGSPITIQGNADSGTAAQIQQILDRQKMEFERMFNEFAAHQSRVSYS